MKMKSLEEPITKVEPVTIIKEDRIQKEEEKKSPDRSPRKAPCLQDFTILSPLGRGAYGEVVLVKKNSNDKMYAMKITDKSFMKIVNAVCTRIFTILLFLGRKRISGCC